MSKVLTEKADSKQKKATPKVLVADEISKEGITIMESSLAVDYIPDITPERLLEVIGGYEALLVRSRSKVTKDVIKAGKKLKLVGRAGVGVDSSDLNAATAAG